MGDRAITIFYTPAGKVNCKSWELPQPLFSPKVYHHWCGGPEGMKASLTELATLMHSNNRDGDESYAAARYCGICHIKTPGAYSLGIESGPETMEEALDEKNSPGDAGVFLVNTVTWEVQCYGGYGFDNGPGPHRLLPST